MMTKTEKNDGNDSERSNDHNNVLTIGIFEKPAPFCPMMRGIANEAFLVGKGALGPHGVNPSRVALGVDGPHKTAGYPQDTVKTRPR